MKYGIIFLLLIIVGVGYWYWSSSPRTYEAPLPEERSGEEMGEEMVVCIQVITPARNPNTGEIREFPTPCDVPEGWEPVMSEGLDIEVR